MGAWDALVQDALSKARYVQEEASDLNFDWIDIQDVLEKLREEVNEIDQALACQDLAHARRELGDVLFSAVNLSRFLKASPIDELDFATQRFSQRFDILKRALGAKGRSIPDCTTQELDSMWEQAKRECNEAITDEA